MALFGGKRDMSFFRHINRELINKIIQSEVDIYKVSLYDTTENIYGESTNKKYLPGVRIATLIGSEDEQAKYEENTINKGQSNVFSFLKDDLIQKSIMIEIGDVIHWNEIYWEIDNVNENKFFMSKNPETNKTVNDDYGWNISIICNAHMTDRIINSNEDIRSGNSEQNKNYKNDRQLY